MAVHHGKNGVVKIGAGEVAEVTAFSYSLTADVHECSAMGDTYKEYVAGLNDGTGSITCFYDPADSDGQDTMSIGASVTLLLYFEDGAASGETEWSIPAIITEVTKSSQRDGIVEHTFSFQGNGAPTEGVV